MRKIFLIFLTMFALFSFAGCGRKYVCNECDKAVFEIYYDIDGEAKYCEDCARVYWAPFDYERYRVKE